MKNICSVLCNITDFVSSRQTRCVWKQQKLAIILLLGNLRSQWHVSHFNNYLLFCSAIDVPDDCKELSFKYNIELVTCGFNCKEEQLRSPKLIRVGLFQHKLVPFPTSTPIQEMKYALFKFANKAIRTAARGGVNIFCFPELWSESLQYIKFCIGKVKFEKYGLLFKFCSYSVTEKKLFITSFVKKIF